MDTEEKITLLKQQLSRVFTAIPFNKMLGLQLDSLSEESVALHFNMRDELIGNFLHGILHGGVISSVLDMAGGMAVMAATIHQHVHLPVEEIVMTMSKTSTIDLQISYLRPGLGQVFVANAWVTKPGKRVNFAQMSLKNETGELIATGSGSYLLK